MDRQSFSDLQSLDEHANELLTRPMPLSYKQLAKGALYNSAQPKRQERESLHTHTPEPFDSSLDQVSEVVRHEDDPPVWPSRGLPFRVERTPSPPHATKRFPATGYQGWRPSHSTVASGALYNPYVRARLPESLAPRPLPRSTTKSSRGHESKVSRNKSDVSAFRNKGPGESQNGDMRYPIPRTLQDPNYLLEAEDLCVHPGYKNLSQSPSRSRRPSDESFHHQRNPSTRGEPINHPPTPSEASVHAPPSRPPSTMAREAPWVQQEHLDPAAFASVHPSRVRTISDDTIYYHPSREGTIRGPPSIHQEPMYGAGSHHPSRAPSVNGGASQHFGNGSIRGPSSLHHELANAGGSQHPSRAPSVNGGGSQHFDDMYRGTPSLHRHGSSGSHHLSRAPSVNGGGSQHFGDSSNMHLSQMPTVIRDSVFKDEDWGLHAGGGHDFHENEGWGGAEGGPVPHHSSSQHLSRASTVKGVESVHEFHPSRAPSVAATHVSRFQDQNGSIHRVPSRAPSAASHRMSQIQHHVGGSRAGTPSFQPPHDTVYEEDYEHQHFEQERAMTPGAASHHGSHVPSVHVADYAYHDLHPSRTPSALNDTTSVHSRAPSVHAADTPAPSIHPSRAPSAMNDAASVRSRAPSVASKIANVRAPSAAGIPSRAPSALTVHGGASPTPTLMRRGRLSVMGRSGRATPSLPTITNEDAYHISVVQPTPTDDTGSHKGPE